MLKQGQSWLILLGLHTSRSVPRDPEPSSLRRPRPVQFSVLMHIDLSRRVQRHARRVRRARRAVQSSPTHSVNNKGVTLREETTLKIALVHAHTLYASCALESSANVLFESSSGLSHWVFLETNQFICLVTIVKRICTETTIQRIYAKAAG